MSIDVSVQIWKFQPAITFVPLARNATRSRQLHIVRTLVIIINKKDRIYKFKIYDT